MQLPPGLLNAPPLPRGLPGMDIDPFGMANSSIPFEQLAATLQLQLQAHALMQQQQQQPVQQPPAAHQLQQTPPQQLHEGLAAVAEKRAALREQREAKEAALQAEVAAVLAGMPPKPPPDYPTLNAVQQKHRPRPRASKEEYIGVDCHICGAPADGMHYNAISCRSCNAFFRRAVSYAHKYVCRFGGNCEITVQLRCACRACRYRKCVEAGMRDKAVQPPRDPTGSQKPKKKKDGAAGSKGMMTPGEMIRDQQMRDGAGPSNMQLLQQAQQYSDDDMDDDMEDEEDYDDDQPMDEDRVWTTSASADPSPKKDRRSSSTSPLKKAPQGCSDVQAARIGEKRPSEIKTEHAHTESTDGGFYAKRARYEQETGALSDERADELERPGLPREPEIPVPHRSLDIRRLDYRSWIKSEHLSMGWLSMLNQWRKLCESPPITDNQADYIISKYIRKRAEIEDLGPEAAIVATVEHGDDPPSEEEASRMDVPHIARPWDAERLDDNYDRFRRLVTCYREHQRMMQLAMTPIESFLRQYDTGIKLREMVPGDVSLLSTTELAGLLYWIEKQEPYTDLHACDRRALFKRYSVRKLSLDHFYTASKWKEHVDKGNFVMLNNTYVPPHRTGFELETDDEKQVRAKAEILLPTFEQMWRTVIHPFAKMGITDAEMVVLHSLLLWSPLNNTHVQEATKERMRLRREWTIRMLFHHYGVIGQKDPEVRFGEIVHLLAEIEVICDRHCQDFQVAKLFEFCDMSQFWYEKWCYSAPLRPDYSDALKADLTRARKPPADPDNVNTMQVPAGQCMSPLFNNDNETVDEVFTRELQKAEARKQRKMLKQGSRAAAGDDASSSSSSSDEYTGQQEPPEKKAAYERTPSAPSTTPSTPNQPSLPGQ